MPTINKPKRKTSNREVKREERMKIYNTARWRELRLIKMRKNPLCEMCEKDGRITAAEDIHHITSFMSVDDSCQRKFLAFDINNLMSLCDKCHQKVHN